MKMRLYNLIFSMLFIFHLGYGQVHVFKIDDFTASQIDSVVTQVMQDSGIVGLAIGIINDRQIVYTQSYGWAEENVTPFSVNTKVRWASISKTITGIMATRMWQDGDLDLDGNLQDYCPEYDYPGFSVRDLLHHQAGIEHYGGNCGPGYPGFYIPDSTVSQVDSCDVCFDPPGSAQLYSSFGSNLLGKVIDTIGRVNHGKGYYDLFKDWIRDPFGLNSLDQDSTNTDPFMATGYSAPGSPTTPADVGWKLPAGGFYSDIIDLSKYCEAILNYEYLERESYDTMWTLNDLENSPTILCDSAATDNLTTNPGYGLHFSISDDLDNTQPNFVASHNGGNEVVTTTLWMKPNKGLGLAILCNTTGKRTSLTLIRNSLQQFIDCPAYRSFTTDRVFYDNIIWEADSLIDISSQISFVDTLIIDSPAIRMDPEARIIRQQNHSLMQAFDEGCGGANSPGQE